MNSADPSHRIQPELRAAISAFVNDARAASRQLALSEAVAAIRQVFPDVVVSDADLADALASEALTAGLDVKFDVLKTPKTLERRALPPAGQRRRS